MLDAVQRQISMVQKIQKVMENPRLQIVEQIVGVSEIQVFDDTQTSESLGIAPVRQVAVENVEVIEIGAPLPAESAPPLSVTHACAALVLEYAAPAPAVTCAAPALAVTYAASASPLTYTAAVPAVTHGASSVTYASPAPVATLQEASLQPPQEASFPQRSVAILAQELSRSK